MMRMGILSQVSTTKMIWAPIIYLLFLANTIWTTGPFPLMGLILTVIWLSIICILSLVICNLRGPFRLLIQIFNRIWGTLFCRKVHLQGLGSSPLIISAETGQLGKTCGCLSQPLWTQICLESQWVVLTLVDTLATQMRLKSFAQDGSSFQHFTHSPDKTMTFLETTLSHTWWMMFTWLGPRTQSNRGFSFQGNFTLVYIRWRKFHQSKGHALNLFSSIILKIMRRSRTLSTHSYLAILSKSALSSST